MSTEPTLDKIDARILRVLQEDGRISNLKLAEAVHLSPTAVLERVKRLTRDGFILGYEARLNPAKLGAAMLVFIEVHLDRTVQDVMDTFKAFDFGSGAKNVHIVGEAYSDYQGFIEGALNSAELALQTIPARIDAEPETEG